MAIVRRRSSMAAWSAELYSADTPSEDRRRPSCGFTYWFTMWAEREPRSLLPPGRVDLPQPNIHRVCLAVVEHDGYAVVVANRQALRAPLVAVLLGCAIPQVAIATGCRVAVRALVDRRGRRAALLRCRPLRQAAGLNDRAISFLELELHRNGAAALKDARHTARATDLGMARVINRLQEAIEAIDHPIASG